MPRERKSDELHDLEGTTSRAAPELSVAGSRPRCPKELSPEARKIFRNACSELEKRRAVTSADAIILELLAATVDKYRRARQHVAEEGEIVEYTRLDKKGEQVTVRSKNLWLGIANEAETKITALLDRLGMTPMNRARVRPTKDSNEEGIKFL
jgi:P27 family predicted phage terminase small subunit